MLSPGQTDVEANLRAELARAERESQARTAMTMTPEQTLRAEVLAAEQRSAQVRAPQPSTRKPRPDSGLGFQAKVLKNF